MSITPDDIDLTELLKPIEGGSPSGEYLRYSDIYDQIINSIREDNPDLEQGLWQYPLKRADWNTAKALCLTALKNTSKDIQICNWLLDSMIHLHGFKGLSAGLEIITQLTIQFWDSVHPLPVNGDYETRLAPYFWLEEKFYLQLRLLPVTDSSALNDPFTLDRWERETKSTNPDYETVYDELSKQAVISGTNYFLAVKNELLSSVNSVKQLKKFLLEKDSQAPHLIQLTSTIESITAVIDMALKEAAEPENDNSGEEPETETGAGRKDETAAGIKVKHTGEPVTDIGRAYSMIANIADYLIKNEPDKLSGYILKNIPLFRKISLKEIYK